MASSTPLVRRDSQSRDEKAAALRRLMETEGAAVAENTRGFNAGRYETVGRLPNYEALKQKARQIKEQAIEQLPALIDQVREAVEARGGTVTVAENAAAANARIRELAQGARRVAKSKSMTTEEIEVNEHLEAAGIDVVETDLAEWVLQLADEPSSHLVVPAMHKSREEIARLVNERFDLAEPLETPEELTRFARRTLWRKIRTADVGMTGANFITADSGTLALVTSEGNAQKSVLMAPTYIAVAGVEKILPSVEDLQPFVELIGRSGTGQDLTSYLSLFSPPFETPVPERGGSDSERERPPGHRERSFHLVLLDNGRRAMRDDPQLKETLYCIRCGACANSCANFQEVGGHAFGGETYSGGIATGWEAGVHGLDSAASFNDLCTGCTRCVNACPVNIDIPWINVVVRDRVNRGRDGPLDWLVDGLKSEPEREGATLRQRLFARFETLARLGSATAPLSNWMNRLAPVRAVLDWAVGIDRRRTLPAFARQTLRQWAARREGAAPDGAERVVLYPDLYTNYVHVERGKAAVRVLETLGLEVEIPEGPGSGRAALSQGLIASAEQKAQAVWQALKDPLEAGRDILVIEPTDLAMFRRRYGKLLPDAAARAFREHTHEVVDYARGRVEAGADAGGLRRGDGQRVAYHSHCQQRTLDLETPTVEFLEALGYDVQTSSVECCGMAGSFGYKSEYYELSMKVGEQLRDEVAPGTSETIAASGTSCMEQLEALLDRPVVHPLQLIAPALKCSFNRFPFPAPNAPVQGRPAGRTKSMQDSGHEAAREDKRDRECSLRNCFSTKDTHHRPPVRTGERYTPSNHTASMTLPRSLFALLFLATVFVGPAGVQTGWAQASDTTEKDAPFVATSHRVVRGMLKVANVSEGDVVYDLGSGDGRIPITAAKEFGARGVGIEIDSGLVAQSRARARALGVEDRVEFRRGDLFKADLSDATVVTLYLWPEVNIKLRPKLLRALDPGDRIVSHDFRIGDWEPDREVDLGPGKTGNETAYLWIVPEEIPPELMEISDEVDTGDGGGQN